MFLLPAFSAKMNRSPRWRYSVAVIATALALLIRWGSSLVIGEYLPYIGLFLAVTFLAWFCGIGPSILAIVLGVVATRYWFVPPTHSLVLPELRYLIDMAEFATAAVIIVAIAELVRRNHAALYQAQLELEDRIQQRTAELNVANQNLGELSARLMHLQDEERRRIARELHDSVGQTLAALSMNLAAVRADIDRLKQTVNTVTDSAALVDDMSKDIRTISYLLHPPLLDEAGLCSALTWYVQGFSERSKIKVDLDIPPDFGRLPRERETAVFRVVQECLTNIHRHSGSPTAKVRITQDDGHVRVWVEDKGKGIPPEKRAQIASSGTPGVGVRGMRERLRQLGGDMEIHSESGKGTKISVQLPTTSAPAQSDAVVKSATAGVQFSKTAGKSLS
jgi:signal transduction histidine kinase